jgi:hypothetical protein
MGRNYTDIAVASGVAVLGCVAVVTPLPTPVMVVLGIGLFASPGYVWSRVLLNFGVPSLEKVGVAVCIALMVPVFGGLVLYAAGIPLHRTSWVCLLAVVTIVGVVVLTKQRRTADPAVPGKQSNRGHLPVRHAVAFGAAAVIAIGAVTLAVIGADTQKYPGYTQLWLSPLENKSLTANLGVTNQQGSTVHYRLQLVRKGHGTVTWNLTLADGQTWQRIIPFTDKYTITANLYRLPDLSHPYRDVTNGDTPAPIGSDSASSPRSR